MAANLNVYLVAVMFHVLFTKNSSKLIHLSNTISIRRFKITKKKDGKNLIATNWNDI